MINILILIAIVTLLMLAPSLSYAIGVATTQTSNMTKYSDPQGRFSVSYPTTWTATPQADRFQTTLVGFADGAGSGMSLISLSGIVHDPQVMANLAVNNLPFGYSMFQNVECIKYKIDGQKVCSYIGAQQADPNLGTPGRVVMQMITNIGGKMYGMTFAAPESTFDSMLPTFETMIHSINFAGNSTGGVSK
jgi:hypothetical protein